MGCGESKHAVAIDNTLRKSKRGSRNQGKKDIISPEKSRNDASHVAADAVHDSNEIKKIDEKEGAVVGGDGKPVSEAEVKSQASADVAAPLQEIKIREKVEEAKADDQEEREEAAAAIEEVKADDHQDKEEREEAAAAVEVVQEKEEVKADVEERETAAAVEVVQEKEEIKNEELEGEKTDGVKADQEEKENVVSDEVADDSSCVEEKISQVEKEELASAEETKPSAEEKTPADQNEKADAAAPPTDVKGN